jgi:hypothetical protein
VSLSAIDAFIGPDEQKRGRVKWLKSTSTIPGVLGVKGTIVLSNETAARMLPPSPSAGRAKTLTFRLAVRARAWLWHLGTGK